MILEQDNCLERKDHYCDVVVSPIMVGKDIDDERIKTLLRLKMETLQQQQSKGKDNNCYLLCNEYNESTMSGFHRHKRRLVSFRSPNNGSRNGDEYCCERIVLRSQRHNNKYYGVVLSLCLLLFFQSIVLFTQPSILSLFPHAEAFQTVTTTTTTLQKQQRHRRKGTNRCIIKSQTLFQVGRGKIVLEQQHQQNQDEVANDDNSNKSHDGGTVSNKILSSSSPLSLFAMDPTSEQARIIIQETLQLSSHQHDQLTQLAILVNEWNTHINLISRKDCTVNVVFGRHVIPSLAPLALLLSSSSSNNNHNNNHNPHNQLPMFESGQSICDVGTGGGFPGLPLAIALPNIEFVLVDSVGKKILAVQDMVKQLQLQNVQTYHGRAESFLQQQQQQQSSSSSNKFDWVIGRSVAALPVFAFWIDDLLKRQKNRNNTVGTSSTSSSGCGHLIYITGGDIDDTILNKAIRDEEISNLLACPLPPPPHHHRHHYPSVSDKRVLLFSQPAIHQLALMMSGEQGRKKVVSTTTTRSTTSTSAVEKRRGNNNKTNNNNNNKYNSFGVNHNNNGKQSTTTTTNNGRNSNRRNSIHSDDSSSSSSSSSSFSSASSSSMSKGQWKKKKRNNTPNNVPKQQRRSDGFQRYDSPQW